MSNMMIARHSSKTEHDDFPTPPWATRALLHYVLTTGDVKGSAWEPACGRGYMTRVLQEKFKKVRSSDVYDYGVGFEIFNFVELGKPCTDWIITNPPYKLAEDFFHTAYVRARVGVALLVRINWLQNGGRFERIFKAHPATKVAIFAGRMPAAYKKVIRGPSGYFQHCWVVWHTDYGPSVKTELMWIPPEAQSKLERDEDYV